MISELLLATKNPDKTAEFRSLLQPLGITVFNAIDFPELPDVVEDGLTLEENALKKAKTLAQITGKPALADDSGLLVDVLNGAPGVFSARYAGEKATYADNVIKLLSELSKKGEFPHHAHFATVLAFVEGKKEHLIKGICEGLIIPERKGNRGFGYDPVFIPNGFNQTFAEMNPEEKHGISHRGKATRAFIEWLINQK